MASILIWAIQMLSALSVPNKWDDPKKPGIQVAQTEWWYCDADIDYILLWLFII